MDDFKKRVYLLGDFFHDALSLGKTPVGLIKAILSNRVDKAFREKLNMAVTGVLGCKYCSWLHSEMALSHGVKDSEIQKILSQEIGDFPEEEAVALAFAQHYSETGGRPGKETLSRFYAYYDQALAKDILFYIQMIYIGNLSGNSIDAFISRIKGDPVEESSMGSELAIFFFLGPYFLIILPMLARMANKKENKKANKVSGLET
ncbi:MAG: carboxymuconolactone decarboxylase family protein [Thermodesulfobacteriota bacterium]|nr:carboxymuconolactone decarboxylase family protein [Thermodesulfobacteriota bacterium]